MIESPSGGMPEKAPRWDLTGTEGCGGGIRFSWTLLMVWGYVGIYRRKKYVGGRLRGPGDRGTPRRGGRTLLSPGRLDCFLTCNTSPLDQVRYKNHALEGFIPFGLRLIFLFFEILK